MEMAAEKTPMTSPKLHLHHHYENEMKYTMKSLFKILRQQIVSKRILALLVPITVVIISLAILQDVAARSSNSKESVARQMRTVNENSAAVIDLNGPDPNYDYATTFTENEGPKPIVAGSMTISDTDGTELQSASVTLTNRPDGFDEFLEINTENTSLTANYDPDSGVLQLGPTDTISNYQKALSSITYNNLSDSPATADRLVIFQVFDGINYSNEAQSTVFIEAVNDAPILDSNGDLRFSDILEDDTTQFGNRVASFIDPAETGDVDRITDPDDNSLEGVAIIGVDSDNGYWQFSTDAGITWHGFGPVTNNAATLLDPTARIRFLPDLNFYGSVAISIRAWDQTFGSNGDVDIDVSGNGGSSAFSSATDSVALEVLPVNDLPIPDLNGFGPGNNVEAYYLLGSGSTPIASPQGAFEDVDNEMLVSAVVTLMTRPDGAVEFLKSRVISSGITIGPYNPSNGELRLIGSATLAEYNNILRGVMYNNESATPSLEDRIIEVVANDGLGDGPTTSTTLGLLSANNAPLLFPDRPMSLSTIYENDKETFGNTVAEIISSAATEPIQDDEGALHGFAIIGASNQDGEWQYSLDAGTTWLTIGVVSDTMAILVDADARIRFLPNTDLTGYRRKITIRAWDQSAGINGSQEVDVSQNGGNSAYSSNTAQISVDVLAVNKAPVLELPEGITAVFTEGNGPVVVAGPSLNVSDVDNQFLKSAAISITNHQTKEADVLSASSNGSGIVTDYNPETGILAMTGESTVAEYQAVLRTVTFENRSHDPATHDRIVTFVVSDILTNSNIVSSTIRVESVNDLPLVDLNGLNVPGNNVTVQFDKSNWGGKAVPISSNLEIQDLDDTSLIAATVSLVDRPDGLSEYLEVNTAGTNIKPVIEQEGGQLQLTGVESLANYERVLRTVTYTNSREHPLTTDRLARFTVQDHAGKSNIAISRIVITPKLVLLPIVANFMSTVPESDEPNDVCQEAYPLSNNVPYEFLAEDKDDWYSFSINKSSNVTIELTEFEPVEGQILVAVGQCDALVRIGHNGNFSTNKIIKLDNLQVGRYYIWLISDNIRTVGEPYKYNLMVKIQ
jgi:hypothetical protein